MQPRYQTLSTIYEIVKQDPQPTSYRCRPREIILRQWQDWGIIQEHLKELQEEGLVKCEQADTLIICMTEAGIERMLLLLQAQ